MGFFPSGASLAGSPQSVRKTLVNAGRQGRIYRSKKARIRDDPAGPRSESAFSLNWITSCLLTIRSEQPLPDASVFIRISVSDRPCA
jgi:hypothetical protein